MEVTINAPLTDDEIQSVLGSEFRTHAPYGELTLRVLATLAQVPGLREAAWKPPSTAPVARKLWQELLALQAGPGTSLGRSEFCISLLAIALSREPNDDPFNNAAIYDCDESAEQLSYGSAEEAIVAWVDAMVDPDTYLAEGQQADLLEAVRKVGPLTVHAFVRETPEASWWRNRVHGAMEDVIERFDDDYGNPDGDDGSNKILGDQDMNHLIALTQAVVLRHRRVWNCKKVASRVYGAEQVLTIVREHAPHWFAPKASATPA